MRGDKAGSIMRENEGLISNGRVVQRRLQVSNWVKVKPARRDVSH